MSLTDEESELPEDERNTARFPVELELPAADPQLCEEARAAVRQELRGTTRWKRLRCGRVSVVSERDRGTVYALHVAGEVDFDWTWEGAFAFRPQALDDDESGRVDMADYENSPVDEGMLWGGEIMEVDSAHGCLFISLSNPLMMPTIGTFFVRPYDFLATLAAVYHEGRFESLRPELGRRLAATRGDVHPLVKTAVVADERRLSALWRHGWSVLWGPPGTGKTYSLGREVAAALRDPSERILVVSTTNRATDSAALAIGRAARDVSPEKLDEGRLTRIGKGASLQSFRDEQLDAMLSGTESEVLARIDKLAHQLRVYADGEDKALARKQIAELRAGGGNRAREQFLDAETSVVVATAFKALEFVDDDSIRELIVEGQAPFTTIFIDEAGLLSRATTAALSLLASRRVVLVGDSKQLAPISRMARVLPKRQETWIAKSGLGHLDSVLSVPPAVHVLTTQYRMHDEVCRVVSEYQYRNVLQTAEEVRKRESRVPTLFARDSRAIWHVLDEESRDLTEVRAERSGARRGWSRPITFDILERLMTDPEVRKSRGLFLSPYRGQAQQVASWLTRQGITSWEASTIHRQQGGEADIVLFDTVNAGSTSWPFEEWKRLINVGLSRAREAVVLLASRAEMDEPFLRPLARLLAPRALAPAAHGWEWQPVPGLASTSRETPSPLQGEHLGAQFAQRRQLRPILSREQQRLTNLELDGKPRLVRGVAGSGKTIVLSSWLAKMAFRMADDPQAMIWAVYANRSLQKLLRESIESAWRGLGSLGPFPWERVRLLHIKDILADLLPDAGLRLDSYDWDYDQAAREFLERCDSPESLPTCRALFVDEAQDLGPHTLRLLLSLVEQADKQDKNSRSAHIFFDNAQNIYGRKTPKWSEFGLDMRGRSTIMRESFRSTRPITELAINLLHQLAPVSELADHKELFSLGLLARQQRHGHVWLRVLFNQVEGPQPIVKICPTRAAELALVGEHLTRLLVHERVSPTDICILYNGQVALHAIESTLSPLLHDLGVELSVQTNRSFERRENTLVVTTSHSYKGYDAEVVLIPCADQFTTADQQILAANLYVAMTRARSILGVYASHGAGRPADQVCQVLEQCARQAADPSPDEFASDDQGVLEELAELLGQQHLGWLQGLQREHPLIREPIFDPRGRVIAQPAFWIRRDGKRYAFFLPHERDPATDDALRQLAVEPWNVGDLL